MNKSPRRAPSPRPALHAGNASSTLKRSISASSRGVNALCSSRAMTLKLVGRHDLGALKADPPADPHTRQPQVVREVCEQGGRHHHRDLRKASGTFRVTNTTTRRMRFRRAPCRGIFSSQTSSQVTTRSGEGSLRTGSRASWLQPGRDESNIRRTPPPRSEQHSGVPLIGGCDGDGPPRVPGCYRRPPPTTSTDSAQTLAEGRSRVLQAAEFEAPGRDARSATPASRPAAGDRCWPWTSSTVRVAR